MDLMDELLTTSDTFYHGKVLIQQLKKGYRFAVDSPILADFLPSADTPALEIGCGVGVVSLLALYRDKFPVITGVEIQESLYRLAKSNALANGMGERFQVVPGDFIEVCARFENIQTIFCNPPFFKAGQGRISPDLTIRLARFEISLTINDLLRCSAAILEPRGSLYLIFPYSRQQELLSSAAAYGLYPAEIRLVQPFLDSVPDRFLARLEKTRTACREELPLVIFKARGEYSPEMQKILSGV
jgi:tRNA1Val (adenine37-N6)-methyltransferase